MQLNNVFLRNVLHYVSNGNPFCPSNDNQKVVGAPAVWRGHKMFG